MSTCPPIAINTRPHHVPQERLWQPYELAFYVAAGIALASLCVAGGSITLLLTRKPVTVVQAVATPITGSLEPARDELQPAVPEPSSPAQTAADRYYNEWMAQIAEAQKDPQ